LKVVTSCSYSRALPINLLGHFLLKYVSFSHNAQRQRQTDRQTDRQQYDANSRPYSAQNDRLIVLSQRSSVGMSHFADHGHESKVKRQSFC